MSSFDRKPNEECRALSNLRVEGEAPIVPVHYDRPSNGQALTRAAADLFGREERIKNAIADLLRNPVSGVPKVDPEIRTGS